MKALFDEFKAFAMRGNIIDLAVAVIIGTAFSAITSSLVNNIVMPLIGIIIGGIDFTSLVVTVGSAEVTYGVFIQSVINFLLIALVVFATLKLMSNLQRKEEAKPEAEKVVETPEDVKLLREIRDLLRSRQ